MQTINTNIAGILATAFEDLRERIAGNIDTAGKRATGGTQESLEVVITEDADGVTATLYGRPFFGALETGSRPWRNQYRHPPKFFRDIMAEWIEAKGLDLSPYLVARKIMREGSALYRAGGEPNIYTEEIPRAVDDLRAAIEKALFTPVNTTHIKLTNTTETIQL